MTDIIEFPQADKSPSTERRDFFFELATQMYFLANSLTEVNSRISKLQDIFDDMAKADDANKNG